MMERNSRIFLLSALLYLVPIAGSDDAKALLSLKSSIDLSNSVPWRGTEICDWKGVKECKRGRVTKLVVEYANLSGSLEAESLNQLHQLRVLSFKGNSIAGQIPPLSGLVNLKSLYLNNNNFSGELPESISLLHRLKVVDLAGNRISGRIPASLLKLRRLHTLSLQDNQLTGRIPALNQTSLKFFNVSNNRLSGEIPATPALIWFNASSFSGNVNLCGVQVRRQCKSIFAPASSPSNYPTMPSSRRISKQRRSKVIIISIVAGTAGIAFLLAMCFMIVLRKRKNERRKGAGRRGKGGAEGDLEMVDNNGEEDENGEKDRVFSWEGEGLGNLVLLGVGEEQMRPYTLEDLLKASAETLGRGNTGSTYKAVMESGFIVTVKRLKDARYPRLEEFRRHMQLLGGLRHPNLVPLRAYFQATEERLLVYDYFPNGSLFSLIHGSRTSGSGKPLHWTSCLKIADDLANGLLSIHQTSGLTHGNLKSSNVLLGSDFESCLTDYGLMPLRDPDSPEETSATSLFYRAPECRDVRKLPTQPADIYSFGVLLLELLTGKTPFQDLVQEHGSDIPKWVRSVREEEAESGDEQSSEEKLRALLNVAMACVSLVPENRPVAREVLRMIREARAEPQVFSSNSSDHSPGRWSDTVQSLPREEHLSI